MDVDPTPEITTTSPVVAPEAPATVCLPYSLVPGLDMSSRSYQRAISTLGKQKPIKPSVNPQAPIISVLERGMQSIAPTFHLKI